MALCAYKDARMRTDDTIIDNIFIRDFMPGAPDGYIKVYLFGLMQCQNSVGPSTPQTFANALGMQEKNIYAAFEYWQQRGLVSVMEHPQYAILYKDVKQALPREGSVYSYSEFNDSIQNIFAPNVATPTELTRIYDWVDVFSIEREAIPVLIEYGRSKMKNVENANVGNQIRYIDRIAQQWADQSVLSQEDALEWIEQQQRHTSGLTALMRKMGMHRAPMAAEKKMYDSWIKQGFTPEAISAATERMTGVYSPSFKYLDNVLAELSERGLKDEQQVLAENSETLCKEALTALGITHSSPTASQVRSYRKWAEDDFSHEHILLACETAKKRSTKSMREIEGILKYWRKNNLDSIKDIRAFEKKRDAAFKTMSEAFSTMGMKRHPRETDMELYQDWHAWGLNDEVIIFAAECSKTADAPYRYMQTIMQSWYADGVKTVKDAREAQEKHAQKSTTAQQKSNPALEYEQREYEDGDLDFLVDEF